MSSPNPPTRKPYPRTTQHSKTVPRNFTEEQIWFVLDRVHTHSTKETMSEFNRHFEGVRTIELNQVKYIRTAYGRDPNWGAPMIVAPLMAGPSTTSRSDRPSQPTQPGVGNQGQAFNGGNTGYMPSPTHLTNQFGANTNANATATDPVTDAVTLPESARSTAIPIGTMRLVPFPRAPHPQDGRQYVDGGLLGDMNLDPNLIQQNVHTPSPLQPRGTQTIRSQQVDPYQPQTLMPELDFSDLLTEGTWHEGTHDDCELDAQHRHNSDDSVFFPSKAAVSKALARSRVFVRPEDLGAMMERIEAHTTAMNALEATLAANMAAAQEASPSQDTSGVCLLAKTSERCSPGSVGARKGRGQDDASGSSLM